MKKGKTYTFKQIEDFAGKNNYEVSEYGGNLIGKNFLVLEHNERDITISFVLTASSGGHIYECIYSDLK